MHDLFKNCFCINLKIRPEKKKRCKELFKNYDIKTKFLTVDKHKNPKQGCFESHMKILNTAYQKKLPYCVIFEDDIDINSCCNIKNLDKIYKFIKKEEYDLFYLGYYQNLKYNVSNTEHSDIIKVKSYGTHAYIISRKFIKKIYKSKFDNLEIDKFYMEMTDDSYALKYQLITQGNYGSDIDLTMNNPLIGSLKSFWTHAQPYYISASCNRNYVIVIILILMLILIIIITTQVYQ